MSVAPETTEESAVSVPVKRRVSPRLLGLVVVTSILVVLGVGALADTLAVAPLRPATRTGNTQQAGLYSLALAISPEPLAANVATTFTLRVTDVSGAPVSGARVTCDFTMPAMPMPTMLVTASATGAGVYICREALTSPGAWALTVTLTPSGGAPLHTIFDVQSH